MKALGLAPAAVATSGQASLAALNEAMVGDGSVPCPPSFPPATSAFKTYAQAWRSLLDDPDMRHKALMREIDDGTAGRLVHLLPPDLAAKRSWSMAVKVREAQLRHARAALARKQDDAPTLDRMIDKLMGYDE